LFEKLVSFLFDGDILVRFECVKEEEDFFGRDIFFGDFCHNLLEFGETAVEVTVEEYERDFVVIADERLHFLVEILKIFSLFIFDNLVDIVVFVIFG